MTTAEELALVDSAIAAMLGGGGVQEFTEAGDSAKLIKYESLCARRDSLRRQLAAEGGGQFFLAEPTDR